MRKVKVIPVLLCIVIILAYTVVSSRRSAPADFRRDQGGIVSGSFDPEKQKTDAEWKKILTSRQYYILRQAGTEIPFTGELNHEKRAGTYYSAGCDEALFRSETKFDSGTGWPSFYAPIREEAVVLRRESGPGDNRIEVLDRCGGHLGHVFDDGPEPTGKRYCMNSDALYFVPDKTN